ncbi:MAG: hypothetical protein GY947_15705 [Rhodobacteraceae bacterium]|nr:hypothetical protein [Paracoccaceae bacterium]
MIATGSLFTATKPLTISRHLPSSQKTATGCFVGSSMITDAFSWAEIIIMIKWLKRFLAGALLISVIWHLSFFIGYRPTRLVGKPYVASFINASEFIQPRLEASAPGKYGETELGDSDVVIVAVLNWSDLNKFENLAKICGPKCNYDAKTNIAVRRFHYNLFGFQKYFFVNIRPFFTHIDFENGQVEYSDSDMDCLIEALAFEIKSVGSVQTFRQCRGIFTRSPQFDNLRVVYSVGYSLRT